MTLDFSIHYTIYDSIARWLCLEVGMKYWSRSALSIYKYLSTMVSTIDKIIMDIGKNSNSAMLQKFQSTYYQASKIIELMDMYIINMLNQ